MTIYHTRGGLHFLRLGRLCIQWSIAAQRRSADQQPWTSDKQWTVTKVLGNGTYKKGDKLTFNQRRARLIGVAAVHKALIPSTTYQAYPPLPRPTLPRANYPWPAE